MKTQSISRRPYASPEAERFFMAPFEDVCNSPSGSGTLPEKYNEDPLFEEDGF